jgi:hypothetical protein
MVGDLLQSVFGQMPQVERGEVIPGGAIGAQHRAVGLLMIPTDGGLSSLRRRA